MDTKSRSIRYSIGFKLLALALCVAGALAMAWGLRFARNFPDAVNGENYRSSREYASHISEAYYRLTEAALTYKSEANILAGNCLTDDMLRSENEYARYDYNSRVNEISRQYVDLIQEAQRIGDSSEVERLIAERSKAVADAEAWYQQRLNDIRAAQIRNQLDQYRQDVSYLKGVAGLRYYAREKDGTAFSNIAAQDVRAFFAALPTYFSSVLTDTGRYTSSGDIAGALGYTAMPLVKEGAEAWVGFAEEGVAALQKTYDENRTNGARGIYWFGAGLLAFLLGMGWLLWAAGRRPDAEGVHLLPVDRIWLDVSIVVVGLAVAACLGGLYQIYFTVFEGWFSNLALAYTLGAALAACFALLLAFWLTSAAKRLKRHEFFKHTFVYAFFSWIFRTVRRMLDAGPLFFKWGFLFFGYLFITCWLIVGFAVTINHYSNVGGTFLFLLFLALNALVLAWILRKASALKAILTGARKIKSGDLAYRIEPTGGAPFADIAGTINNIAEGLNAAVENRVRAERMKTELVTNVSHDLKTPLTSIITYIDLLKAEGPGSENAARYIDVLDAKARRLKDLTDDLFEAAKAASGSIVPSIVRLDITELLAQGLGELEDRIAQSGLDFRVSLPSEKLIVRADGKLLWRVLQNLLSNVFKYAMPNSRVYVSAARAGSVVRVEMKNISACELNIPAEELTERFTRGDESRASEGSGLGLAIAKSLTELQGGVFRIEIDGDLFKAAVEFKEDIL